MGEQAQSDYWRTSHWAPFLDNCREQPRTSITVQAPKDCLRSDGGSVEISVQFTVSADKPRHAGRTAQAFARISGRTGDSRERETCVLELWTWTDPPRPERIRHRMGRWLAGLFKKLVNRLAKRRQATALDTAQAVLLDELVVLLNGAPIPHHWSPGPEGGRWFKASSTRVLVWGVPSLAVDSTYEIRFMAKNLISPPPRQWPFPQVRLRLGFCVPLCRNLPALVRWIYPGELELDNRQDNAVYVSDEIAVRPDWRERVALFVGSAIVMECTWGTTNPKTRLEPSYQLARTGGALVMAAAGLTLFQNDYESLAGVVFAIALAPVLIRLIQATEGARVTFADFVWLVSFIPYVALGLSSAIAVVWRPHDAELQNQLVYWDFRVGLVAFLVGFLFFFAANVGLMSHRRCDWWKCSGWLSGWLKVPARAFRDPRTGRRLCGRHRSMAKLCETRCESPREEEEREMGLEPSIFGIQPDLMRNADDGAEAPGS